MASWASGVSTNSTSNTNSYTTGNFTPSVGDLLVGFVIATATVAASPTLSNSAGTTFTKVGSYVKATSADTLYLFVANSLVTSATLQTCTFDCTGDNATGCNITIARISGMSRTGLDAIRQYNGQSNQAAGTPAPAFSSAALTGNLCMGFVGNATSPAGLTIPSGWTGEMTDTGYANPTTGAEGAYVNSGFTGTTVTWGSSSASDFCSLIVELDTTVPELLPARWRYIKRARGTYRRM